MWSIIIKCTGRIAAVSFPAVWKFDPNDLQPGDMDQEVVDIFGEVARLQEEEKPRAFGLSTPFNRTILGRRRNDKWRRFFPRADGNEQTRQQSYVSQHFTCQSGFAERPLFIEFSDEADGQILDMLGQ